MVMLAKGHRRGAERHQRAGARRQCRGKFLAVLRRSVRVIGWTMANENRCVILVPALSLEPETLDLLGALHQRGYEVRELRGESAIDRARSSMATEAMRNGFDETFWIDADMSFDPDHVETIRSHGLPMCAGLYVTKKQIRFAGKFGPDVRSVTFGNGGGLVKRWTMSAWDSRTSADACTRRSRRRCRNARVALAAGQRCRTSCRCSCLKTAGRATCPRISRPCHRSAVQAGFEDHGRHAD